MCFWVYNVRQMDTEYIKPHIPRLYSAKKSAYTYVYSYGHAYVYIHSYVHTCTYAHICMYFPDLLGKAVNNVVCGQAASHDSLSRLLGLEPERIDLGSLLL